MVSEIIEILRQGEFAMERHMEERLRLCSELAARMDGAKNELIAAAAKDAGFPKKITGIEVDLSVQHLKTMDEELVHVKGKKPYGLVAAVFPYDAPAVMLARLGGAAIIGGNRLRFSFSSLTPRSAEIITEIVAPFEQLESVFPMDNRKFGQQCVDDPEVRVLFISGSGSVGEYYKSTISHFDKIFFAGPGGMPAAVVFENADPRKAAEFIVSRAFINGGQYCTTIKRALIHKSLYEEVKQRILAGTDRIKVGDPMDDDTDMGPIKASRTRALMGNAVKSCKCAKILRGSMDGEWIMPFVIETNSYPDLELFGPFLVLHRCDSEKQLVDAATATQYGFLLAYFGNPSEGVVKKFRDHFGMVHDNPAFRFTPLRLPFGGKGKSGWILTRKNDHVEKRDGAFIYSRELVKDS